MAPRACNTRRRKAFSNTGFRHACYLLAASRTLAAASRLFLRGCRREGCVCTSLSTPARRQRNMWKKHVLNATSAMAMYIQYFSRKDFSRGGSTTLPSAVTGGGTRSEGLFEASHGGAGGTPHGKRNTDISNMRNKRLNSNEHEAVKSPGQKRNGGKGK